MSSQPVKRMTLAQQRHDRLADALDQLNHRGVRVPCYRSDVPTSDNPILRERAIKLLCSRCPIRELCAEAGKSEEHFVWGARDRSTENKVKNQERARLIDSAQRGALTLHRARVEDERPMVRYPNKRRAIRVPLEEAVRIHRAAERSIDVTNRRRVSAHGYRTIYEIEGEEYLMILLAGSLEAFKKAVA